MSDQLIKATIYWDETAGTEAGWAYRLRYEGGREESGAVDGPAEDDCCRGALSQALSRVAGVPAAECSEHTEEGGYVDWEIA